jgi:hypothetical protein
MKTKFQHIAIAAFSIATLFGSCKKEAIRPMNVSDKSEMQQPAQKMALPDQNLFEPALCRGPWSIRKFDDGRVQVRMDQTSQFHGYTLKFYSQHVVIAKSLQKTVTGKWNTVGEGDFKKLILDFGNTPFIALNGSWTVNKYSAAGMHLTAEKREGTAVLDLAATGDMPK